jgi:membrane protein YdbS with pleckstrin-like domain
MALGECRECGKQVSTEAATCPHCGAPRPTARTEHSGVAPRGYVGETLSTGERVLYRTHLHWITFLRGWILMVLLVACGVAAWFFGSVEAGVAFVAIAALVGVAQYLRYASSEFAVTDARVLVKIGWIRRRSIEILISKVESIVVDQGLAGRVFNYGTIVVTGTGGTRETFDGIAAPLEFREKVQAQITSRGRA